MASDQRPSKPDFERWLNSQALTATQSCVKSRSLEADLVTTLKPGRSLNHLYTCGAGRGPALGGYWEVCGGAGTGRQLAAAQGSLPQPALEILPVPRVCACLALPLVLAAAPTARFTSAVHVTDQIREHCHSMSQQAMAGALQVCLSACSWPQSDAYLGRTPPA